MPRTTFTVGLLAITTISCAAMRENGVKKFAANEFNCPVDQITYTPAPRGEPEYVSGCGQSDAFVIHCVSAVGSGGTASSCKQMRFSEAITQASFSSGCAKEEIKATWLKPNLGLEVCGTRMTFVPTLSGWILGTQSEGPSGGADAAAGAPAQ